MQWEAAVIDIRTAFLNAMMQTEEGESLIIIKAPRILVEKGCLPQETWYIPIRAVYGLRRSPRLWGKTRDAEIEEVKLKVKGPQRGEEKMKLVPLDSEPNLWKVIAEKDEEMDYPPLRGLLMTYVDDMFITGEREVVEGIIEEVQMRWKTSQPEWLSDQPVRFLGMEVAKKRKEEGGREIWNLTQTSYTRDLLSKDETVKPKKIPISRDLSVTPSEEEVRTPKDIRQAQKEVGELLWLVTRSRPDLMFAISRMGSEVTQYPHHVHQIATQVKGYLKITEEDGIEFDVDPKTPWVLDAHADASYAPEGEESRMVHS